MGLHNERRRALGRLGDLRKAVPSPLSGKDSLLVSQVAFYDDPERFTRNVHALCEEIEERVRNHEGIAAADAPRLLVTGCPMVAPNWKVPHILEKAGAVIAVEEMCTGVKYYRDLADETGETVEELLDAIADRYFNIDCAVFTPNRERVDHIRELVRDWRIDGVVYYTLQFCDPYSVEAHQVKSALASDGVPCLYIETDYSKEDVSQIATRAEAFLEMLRSARAEKA
jgi:benzoyl-CoA reductase/2-hydroxyglutaryl-CoA dehydratase subunit BcrC/BadD/HgdB